MAAQGVRLRKVVLWMGIALAAAALMSAQVYRQNLYIRLAREEVKLERESRLLQNDLAALELEVKALSKRQRLEQLAQSRFGLVYAGAPEPIYLDGNGAVYKDDEVAMATFNSEGNAETIRGTQQFLRGAMRWLTSAL